MGIEPTTVAMVLLMETKKIPVGVLAVGISEDLKGYLNICLCLFKSNMTIAGCCTCVGLPIKKMR